MSTTLTQLAAASFADRPIGGGMGLRVDMTAGDGGPFLRHDFQASRPTLHARFAVRIDQAGGGSLVPLRGVAGDATAFELALDVDAASVALNAGGISLAGALAWPIRWHIIETRYDLAAEQLQLWIDGRSAGAAALPADTGDPVDAIEFGAAFRDAQLVGSIDLDELQLADSYIGPVVRQAAGPYANDPARWLVLYNPANADSASWVESYRQHRGVPFANLLGLDMPGEETIDEATALEIRDAVDQYLGETGLAEQVMGVLCGHGAPGAFVRGDGAVEPLASMLQAPDAASEWAANPLFTLDPEARPTIGDLGGRRLAARIDGPSLAESEALIHRAHALAEGVIDSDGPAALWLDAVAAGSGRQLLQSQMLEWADGKAAAALRIRIERTEPRDPPTEVGFTEIHEDAFFWGWAESTPPDGFFAAPAGRRVFAVQLDETAATAATLRDASASPWARAALEAGYAATAGTTGPISIGAIPRVEPFFEALRRGWTLAEAWGLATPNHRARQVLIGDPLLTVRTPRAGYDIIGPLGLQDQAAESAQVAALRADAVALDLPVDDQPEPGRTRRYLIRRIDGSGRSDGVARSVSVTNVAGRFVTPPPAPLWPAHADWWPRREGHAFEIVAIWAVALNRLPIDRVELQVQTPDAAVNLAGEVPPTLSRRVAFTHEPTSGPVRYRVRVISAEGADALSPWSSWVELDTPGFLPLTPLEF